MAHRSMDIFGLRMDSPAIQIRNIKKYQTSSPRRNRFREAFISRSGFSIHALRAKRLLANSKARRTSFHLMSSIPARGLTVANHNGDGSLDMIFEHGVS